MVNVNNTYVATPPVDGGVLFSAPLGTDLPETVLDELDELFEDNGAIGENGIQIQRPRQTQDIKMFGGDTLRTTQPDYTENLVVTFMEDDNDTVLGNVYGDANVTVSTANEDGVQKVIRHTSEPLPIKSWVAKSIDGEKTKWYVVERGQVIETAEVTDVHSDVTRHQVTIKCYKGTTGENVRELRNDASKAVTTP